MVAAPDGTTHFRIVSAGLEIDFEKGKFTADKNRSAEIAWDNNPTAMINHVNTVNPNSPFPLFLLVGIQYLQELTGVMYPLLDGSYNALSIVKVSGV